jgi:asparagine synthase (glutamine-hydrolysing)
MTRALTHRGPDSDGLLARPDDGVYLGFRRLSIIDLSPRGSQPMANETGDIWLVFNGEIYNHRALRRELVAAGHDFRSDADSEVILHGYEAWGTDVVLHLRGMFAFAVWDGRRKRLVLGRDRIGIKPLYYLDLGHSLVFASEARAFQTLPGDLWRPHLNHAALPDLVALGYLVEPQQSVLAGLKTVPPGSILVLEDGVLSDHTYWSLGDLRAMPAPSYDEARDEVSRRLTDAVGLMLQADVPVGVLLSGGIDSSVVTALAQQQSAQPVRTFTVGYAHAKDERAYAESVSQFLGTAHTSLELDYTRIFERLPEICAVYDDLCSTDGGFVSTYLIAEQVRAHGIKVVLVGEGGDEVFGGYSPFSMARPPWQYLPSAVRAALHFYIFGHTLVAPGLVGAYGRFRREWNQVREADLFRQTTQFEITRQLPHNYLMKVDKGTMAHGLEARVPYLDESVVEYAYALPAGYKMTSRGLGWNAVEEKRVLKDIGRGLLPPAIAARRKQGFSLPQESVVSSNAAAIGEIVTAHGSLARDLMSPARLSRLLRAGRHARGARATWSNTVLWRLLTAELWWQSWRQASA